MYEVSCVGGSKVDAAAAIRQTTRPQVTVKNQMMRLLRRSKSLARAPTGNHHHHDPQPPPPKQVQVARNGAVVAIVDVLPFVVGAKNKKKVQILNSKCDDYMQVFNKRASRARQTTRNNKYANTYRD